MPNIRARTLLWYQSLTHARAYSPLRTHAPKHQMCSFQHAYPKTYVQHAHEHDISLVAKDEILLR